MAEGNYIIDSPVSSFSTEVEVRAWIEELKKLPQEDLAVKTAMEEAEKLLELVSRSE